MKRKDWILHISIIPKRIRHIRHIILGKDSLKNLQDTQVSQAFECMFVDDFNAVV